MIHTFQLVTPPLSFARHHRIITQIYEHAKQGVCRIIKRQENLLLFLLPHYPGLRICLNNMTVPHVTMVVNPAIMLGGQYQDLCCLTPEHLSICMEPVSYVLKEFKVGFAADQMILSRIDCTVDIQFPQENALETFISCIQHTDLPRGYHIERFGKQYPNYKEMNQHSFRMACKDVCLTVYDKSYQLLNEGLMEPGEILPDRLRFEAAFCNSAFQRILAKHRDCILIGDPDSERGVQKLVIWFSKLSLRLLQDYFEQHMTPGQYLRGDLALQRIDSGHFSAKVKERMKSLLTEVARCHKGGIGAALRNLEGDGFSRNELKYLLRCFEKINLNPATINGSAGYQAFPSVAELLRNENDFINFSSLCSGAADGT